MVTKSQRPTVVMVGATGIVGSAVQRALTPYFRVVGLTRSTGRIRQNDTNSETEWRRCDLFSLIELEQSLEAADYAIYLADSQMPSARLLQGTPADLDLLLADNFARAAQHCGLKQIVTLGGLIPVVGRLSPHLSNRAEVEEALGSGSTPLTALRAGLVVGPGGSSLRIVVNLVRRLPVMILPEWTLSQMQPIALDDVVRAVRLCIGNSAYFGRHFDIGGPEIMTFRALLEQTASVLGKKRLLINVPFFSVRISKLWVKWLGTASSYVVGPLVDSLCHPMIAEPNPLQNDLASELTSFEPALRAALNDHGRVLPNPRDSIRHLDDQAIREARRVRSVQRLPLPRNRSAHWMAQEYYRWMPTLAPPFLRCDSRPDGKLRLTAFFERWLLIELTHAPFRSSEDRQLFYITGGCLARTKNNQKGRIEFREIRDRRFALVAIHDYKPTLPWFLYSKVQAIFHLWVMRRFRNHLTGIDEGGDS